MSYQETWGRSAHFLGLNLFQMNFQLIQSLKEVLLPSGFFCLIFILFLQIFVRLRSFSILPVFTLICLFLFYVSLIVYVFEEVPNAI
jgi:hypothetical protein